MNKDQLEALKEWVKSEVEAGIAGAVEDSEGYIGNNRNEEEEAERLFDIFSKSVEGK